MIVTDWQARHGLDAAAYQQHFNQLVDQGYRLVKVTGYSLDNEARFAGIWHRRGGNAWQARHGISEPAYQAAVTDLEREKYRPTHVSVFRLGDQTLFSAIWEQEWGLPWIARHNLASAEYQQLFDELSQQGYRLRCVSGYEVGGEARYACIWDRYAGPAWQARHGLDAAAYQHEFDALRDQGFRLFQVAGYNIRGVPLFAAIWEQSPGYGWQARHGIPHSGYQSEFDDLAGRGFRLVDASGYSAGSSAEYTTIWEDASPDQPGANAVNGFVIPFMQKWAVPGMSLAVARSGNLLTARSFGLANLITRETVTSTTRFRLASVSKPITATAIFRLIEGNRLNLGDRVFGTGAILGTQFGTTPYGLNIENITVRHLLEHTAGAWKNDGNDPMFKMPNLNARDLISWTLDNQPLIDAPGTTFRYSNFGYCVLGRVIEVVTGQSYGDYVRGSILAPCGVTEMTIAGSTAHERQAGEAMYVGKDLDAPYDMPVRRMDSHGGWIGAPLDVLRFLQRYDGFANPPDLLAPATIADMTTASAANSGYSRGWSINTAGTWWHGGTLPGSEAILVRLANQHEWAAVCNTGQPLTNHGLELDQLMWNVDSVV